MTETPIFSKCDLIRQYIYAQNMKIYNTFKKKILKYNIGEV